MEHWWYLKANLRGFGGYRFLMLNRNFDYFLL